MGYLILPALVLIFVPTPAARAHQLEDFSRFSREIGKEVSLVDRSGLIREGIVEATADAVILRVGSVAESLPRAEVARADRMKKDGRIDGVIEGALVGFALRALANASCDTPSTPSQCPSASWVPVAALAVVGYVIDATEANPRPLYRAPSSSAPTLKLSMRF